MPAVLLDRRFLVVLACSLVLATGVSALFYKLARAGRASGATGFKDAVVAAELLPAGSVLHAGMVKVRRVPAAAFPKDGFSRIEDVVERPVVGTILADEPVVDARLAARGGGFGLSPLIPAGMRAVSVRVNDVVGVSGFAQAGARVDVLVTGKPPRGEESVTATVLQDVAVLSAGPALQPDPKGAPIVAQVVTLLVAPPDAEVLTLAQSEGHIQLVLRNTADHGRPVTTGRGLAGLYRTSPQERIVSEPARTRTRPATVEKVHAAAPAPVVPVAAPKPPDPYRIVVMNGMKVTVATFETPDARND